ncbi:MAG TPA: enoyl-CoA hydratase/isomerase family protein [Actinomycetota bacterium]|jgi:enoyl-CoA hydratase/carnithine racemase|nr:enoyl-CoA hydratase/isomerase family protein [Actinomycetota bacterium]
MKVMQTQETRVTEIASSVPSMTRLVYLDVADGVATIRLDHPRRNVIDLRVAAELHDVALEVGRRDDVRAVVVWGGERIFSAGGDVELMSDRSADTIRPVIAALAEALVVLEAVPKVVIAAINGICLGGGCEIALAADFRFASETALLGQPEIRFGIMPGAGATQRMPRLIGLSAAKDLIYSGRRVKAREALGMGLVDRLLPGPSVYAAALEAAASYAEGPIVAIGAAKAAINAVGGRPPAEDLDLERDLACGLFDTEDQKEGMQAFLGSRRPLFKGR